MSDNGMITVTCSSKEYELWILENKEVVLEFIKENEVWIKDLPIRSRTYSALRMNGFNYLSDIIFMSSADFEELEFMTPTSAKEIASFCREYLRDKKQEIIRYALKDVVDIEETLLAESSEYADSSTEGIDVQENTSVCKIIPSEAVYEELTESFESEVDDKVVDEVIDEKPVTIICDETAERESAAIICKEDAECDSVDETVESEPVGEICDEASECDQASVDDLDIKQILNIPYLKEKVIEYAAIKDVPIESFDFSVRSYNCLKRAGSDTLAETLSYYPDRYINIRNMGAKSAEEICNKIEAYLSEHHAEIISFFHGEEISAVIEEYQNPFFVDIIDMSVLQMLEDDVYGQKANEYLKDHEVYLENFRLSVRSENALRRSGIHSLSGLLKVYPDGLKDIPNLGAGSIREIETKTEEILQRMQPIMAAYCCDDFDVLYSNDFVESKILEFYDQNPFIGISFKEFRTVIPAEVDDDRIKSIVGKMLADNELEYVDFRCYKTYPSFYKALEEATVDSDPKYKEILSRKYHGETLEEIGQSLGITRERVRQLLKKAMEKLRAEFKKSSGLTCFDEAYYEYLYSNYDLPKEACFEYLNISEDTLNYLKNTYSAGKKKIAEALNDSQIDLTLKMRITDYLNKDKVLIDGILIDRNRASLEDYFMSKHCLNDIVFEDFAVQFNLYLKQQNLDNDEKLVYTEELKRTRKNRLAESLKCLWKQGERLRYYDIAAYDYAELLDVLNLDAYENIELSALKFFVDYPEIMEKYDIRDQYELHNLLKKIIPNGKYHDIAFHRQPMIAFGKFDRTTALLDIMAALSPVSSEDLAEYIHLEYGYDKATTLATYLQPLTKYYHNGIYSVDFKRISEDKKAILKNSLTEDFYFINEIKKIYSNLFVDADMEEINPRTLKDMGFLVYSNYAIQNHPHAEAYFKTLLLKDDIFSVDEFRKRYSTIQLYYNVFSDLRMDLELFFFENNKQVINFRRLDRLGITKQDIKDYCDEVYEYSDIDAYFTIHSLRNDGFVSKLDDLGFDDSFYASILATYPRLRYQQIFGTGVLYKGDNLSVISKKSFIISLVEQYDSISVDEIMEECLSQYGIKIPNAYDIKEAIVDTKMYYDPIMGKVYRNKEYYYADIDD